jgi:hypothetical protein
MELVNNIITIAMPTIVIIVVAIITYVGAIVLPSALEYIESKIGVTRYNHLIAVGTDIWGLVEDYKRLNPEFASSITNVQSMFGCEIKKVIPALTETEIIQIRQTIAGVVNKDRPITPVVPVLEAVEKVAVDIAPQIVAPIIKYVTENGVELQPVVAPVVEPIADTIPIIIPQ